MFFGQREGPLDIVARARGIRVELRARLIMADVVAIVVETTAVIALWICTGLVCFDGLLDFAVPVAVQIALGRKVRRACGGMCPGMIIHDHKGEEAAHNRRQCDEGKKTQP